MGSTRAFGAFVVGTVVSGMGFGCDAREVETARTSRSVASATTVSTSGRTSDAPRSITNSAVTSATAGASRASAVALLPSATTSKAAAPPAPGYEMKDINAAIVWRQSNGDPGGFRSQWVQRTSDGAEVAAEARGLVAVSSHSLWVLKGVVVRGCKVIKHDADGGVVMRDHMPVYERPRMNMPRLVSLSGDKRQSPWSNGHGYPFFGKECSPGLQDYGVSVHFEGAMGSYVVASVSTYQYSGGAHGTRSRELMAMDLETAQSVKLNPPRSDVAALKKTAHAELGGDDAQLWYAGVVPMYGPIGAGLALYHYIVSASYAGGSGGNSYSNDHVISSKSLPPELARYQQLPKWLVSHLKGKSRVVLPVPPASLAKLRQQFDKAYAE